LLLCTSRWHNLRQCKKETATNVAVSFLRDFEAPPGRVSENRETLHVQGGVLSPASLLPTSFFPVETSQSRRKKGGLQTAFDSVSDSFF
jgi:hypothetical protein